MDQPLIDRRRVSEDLVFVLPVLAILKFKARNDARLKSGENFVAHPLHATCPGTIDLGT